jgi:hypothetical protein
LVRRWHIPQIAIEAGISETRHDRGLRTALYDGHPAVNFVLAIPFVDWIIGWQSEKPERRSLTNRIGVISAVVLLACSVQVNAHGAVLRSSICWSLKAHDVDSIDQDPGRVWS